MIKEKPKSETKKAKPRTVISEIIGEKLIETIYAPRMQKTALGVWDRGTFSAPNSYPNGNNEVLKPPSPSTSLIRHNVVLFPSFAEDYGSQSDLICSIRSFIHRYVDLEADFEIVAAHYVLLSWVYDRFRAVPYLRIIGDFGSGKSRFLAVVGSICYKPFFASGSSTLSPIFYTLDQYRGTLILDEGDLKFSGETADMVKVLNNGNTQGFPVLRSEISKDGVYSPRAFKVFGPKIIATRGSYSDPALESRMITYRAKAGQVRGDIPTSLPESFETEAENLRNQLLIYRFKNWHTLEPDQNNSALSASRSGQVFHSLMIVTVDEEAKAAILRLAEKAKQSLKFSYAFRPEEHLLKIIRELSNSTDKPLSVQSIASKYREKHGSDHTGPVTNKWVGGILRNRLHLSTQKRSGVYVIAPSDKRRLEALFERYGLLKFDQTLDVEA